MVDMSNSIYSSSSNYSLVYLFVKAALYQSHNKFSGNFNSEWAKYVSEYQQKEEAEFEEFLNFSANLFEFHSAVEVNLLKVDPMYRRFSPYIFGGVSVFYFNPYTGDANDEKVYLKPLATEGQGLPTYTDRKNYNLVNFAVPMGGGMKVLIGKKVLVSAEMGFRFTMTDYLDDVSKSFVNMDTLYAYKGRQSVDLSFRRDEIKGWERDYPSYGYQRGDKRSYDMYWFGGIGVTLYFDSFGNLWPYGPSKCPKKNSMW
jgi:hypothetical protein